MGSIDVVGLGAGRFGLLTLEALDKIEQAQYLFLRTEQHPTVSGLKARGINFAAYDAFYQEAENFAELYERIAQDLVKKARAGMRLVYAVPGSPVVAEKTVRRLRELCAEEDIPLHIYPGMSFLEILCTELQIDPIEGVTIVDAEDIDRLPADLKTSWVITQIYNQRTASLAKLSLMNFFSDEYLVTYVHNLGLPDVSIRQIPLYELDRQKDIDHLTSLYVPRKTKRR